MQARYLDDTQPIDRYHYTDDIYSNSGGGGPQPVRPKKKRRGLSGWAKALIVIGSILLGLFIALIIAVMIFFSGLNIVSVDTSQYEETPADVAGYEIMDSPDVTNVLIIGADRNSDGSEGRSDTMMVASINSKTHELKLVSFLRDLYVSVPGYGYDRLNAAYSYGGPAMLMQTIENNFRINIDKFIETNFDGFENIIDAIGGIDVEMTYAEAAFLNEWKGVGAVEGTNHLNGENALYFARMRKLDSDFGRTTRQRQVISSMFTSLKSSGPFTMLSAGHALMPYLTTNMSRLELISFAISFASSGNSETLSIPSDGTYYDYTTETGAMVLMPYYDANIALLKEFLYS